MKVREGNSLRILVIAGSSERRSSLSALARSVNPRVSTETGTSLEQVFQRAPELTVVDVDSPVIAAAMVRTAKALPDHAGLIALADAPDPAWVGAALRAGINAILACEVTTEELELAIQAAEAGLVLLHPSSVHDLAARQNRFFDQDTETIVEALTAREQQVLRLAGEGLGNKEIATRLNISDHTVKFHISSILGKLGATSRTEAVSQGIRRGLIAI